MRQSTSKALNKEIFGVQNASFFFCFALKIIFFRITIQVIVEQKNQHKFHNVLVFGLFILNYISLCKTWWLCLPAWFENDPKSIYVLVYMQEHPKTFNSMFKINESQIFNVYPFFSPGVYVHDTSQSKVSWPMKFSSPDWSKVPSLERRALRTEVQICLTFFYKLQFKETIVFLHNLMCFVSMQLYNDKEFRKQRNRVAYLSLFYWWP